MSNVEWRDMVKTMTDGAMKIAYEAGRLEGHREQVITELPNPAPGSAVRFKEEDEEYTTAQAQVLTKPFQTADGVWWVVVHHMDNKPFTTELDRLEPA